MSVLRLTQRNSFRRSRQRSRIADAAVRMEDSHLRILGATVSARKVTAIRPIGVAGVRRPIVLLIAVRGFRFCVCYRLHSDGGTIASIIESDGKDLFFRSAATITAAVKYQ